MSPIQNGLYRSNRTSRRSAKAMEKFWLRTSWFDRVAWTDLCGAYRLGRVARTVVIRRERRRQVARVVGRGPVRRQRIRPNRSVVRFELGRREWTVPIWALSAVQKLSRVSGGTSVGLTDLVEQFWSGVFSSGDVDAQL